MIFYFQREERKALTKSWIGSSATRPAVHLPTPAFSTDSPAMSPTLTTLDPLHRPSTTCFGSTAIPHSVRPLFIGKTPFAALSRPERPSSNAAPATSPRNREHRSASLDPPPKPHNSHPMISEEASLTLRQRSTDLVALSPLPWATETGINVQPLQPLTSSLNVEEQFRILMQTVELPPSLDPAGVAAPSSPTNPVDRPSSPWGRETESPALVPTSVSKSASHKCSEPKIVPLEPLLFVQGQQILEQYPPLQLQVNTYY